jgi:hypothetical protein
MKPDVLERLLMDSALGRLDADVEALLADYLAGDPVAATQAQELQSVVRLATDTVRTPLPAIELPGKIHRLVWRHRTEQVFALAASFVVGAGITALVFHANLRRENVAALRTPAIPSSPAAARTRTALVAGKLDSLPFWSNQRVYLLAAAASKGGADSKERLQ